MNFRTLIVDVSMQPIKIVSWQKAIILLLSQKAQVLDEYENIMIRSSSTSYKLPSILMIKGKSQRGKMVVFNRNLIFLRDDFKCGYCLKLFQERELTLDHIIPVCQGGEKSWTNIVTACQQCNLKKGGRTPDQARMELKIKPFEPRWSPLMCLKLRHNDLLEKWSPLLGQLKIESY